MKLFAIVHHVSAVAAFAALLVVLPPRGLEASSGEEERAYDLLHRIEVQLGDKNGGMRFYPGEIMLNLGETYKLVLTNPSPVTHEFASVALADHIDTKKMEIFDRAGNLVAYIRGTISEVELLPGGRIEWAFTTKQPGERIDLFCGIPGHLAAGMHGEIRIRDGQLASKAATR